MNNKQEGLNQVWYQNGSVMLRSNKHDQLKAQGNYVNDKQEGLWKQWYQNGQLCEKGNYVNGKREGLWIERGIQMVNFVNDEISFLSFTKFRER